MNSLILFLILVQIFILNPNLAEDVHFTLLVYPLHPEKRQDNR